MTVCLLVVVFLQLASVVRGDVFGVDVSTQVSTSLAKCFFNEGIRFAVVRAFRCSGTVDSVAIASINALRSAGIAHVGVYMFPCVSSSCTAPASQVKLMQTLLQANNIVPDSVW